MADRVHQLSAVPILAPSILSADFSCLATEIESVERLGIHWLHVDVMDGHFVPNMTIGPVVVESLRKKTESILDCHLMVREPEKFIPWFVKAGADIITVHHEASSGPLVLINQIKQAGVLAGISIKPKTPVEVLEPFLARLDLVLVMSVEPGFGGQSFIPDSLKKVEWLRDQKKKHGYSYLIEIDGGINLQTAAVARTAGVEVFVAGSAVFSATDRAKAVNDLNEAIR